LAQREKDGRLWTLERKSFENGGIGGIFPELLLKIRN